MKIKGVIEDLNFFKKIRKEKKERKNVHKNSKNVSRTFFGGVVVGVKGWQSAHCGLGSAPWALGTGASGGMGLGRPQVWEDRPSWGLAHSL